MKHLYTGYYARHGALPLAVATSVVSSSLGT